MNNKKDNQLPLNEKEKIKAEELKNDSVSPNEKVTSSSNEELKVEENKQRFLSPGQMVLKRFFRSRLSVIGLVTLIVLFAFSFLGPLFRPIAPFIWGETEVDRSQGNVSVQDMMSPYWDKITQYSAQRQIFETLILDNDVKATLGLQTLDPVESDAEKLKLNNNISKLYEHLKTEPGSYTYDGETCYFEIVYANRSYTIYGLEENDKGDLARVQKIIYQRSVTASIINKDGGISFRHLLGTDGDAQDVFSRLMYGGRISLTIGFVIIFLQMLIAMLLGGLAGYFGKWVDNIIMRVIDVLYCLPGMPVLLIFSAVLDGLAFKGQAKLYMLMGMLAIIGWTGSARVIRGQILFLREQEFMVAAEALGLGVPRRIVKHLIPNVMPLLIVQMTLGLGGIILTESTLSYLGLGLEYPAASWGSMINLADNPTVLAWYPNQWIPAGVMIVLAVLAFNFIGDGLRDAFDPKSRR